MRVWFTLAAAALCAGVVTSAASANHVRTVQAGFPVPMFCGTTSGESHSPTFAIPAGSELIIRLGWGTKNEAQSRQFLNSQKLLWTVERLDGTDLVTRPDPGFGDTSNWSAPTYTEFLQPDGKIQKFWLTNYQTGTGVSLAAGETVRITYVLTADTATDDGFGFKFKAGEVLSSGSSCTVTGY
jgi:hypothetical protein